MAYDESLADRIREHLAGEPVSEKKMFGGLGFLLGGHLAVSASGQGGLLVRCEPDATASLLAEPGVARMEMSGRRPMDGWLRVAADAVSDEDDLARWVERGVAYARSLPPSDRGHDRADMIGP
jgi:TfoX/Sxy family transcriptional regulator of competence genes